MTILSKRARRKVVDLELEVEMPLPTVIIIDGSAQMTPEEIKRAKEVFREIRRQLDAIGKTSSP